MYNNYVERIFDRVTAVSRRCDRKDFLLMFVEGINLQLFSEAASGAASDGAGAQAAAAMGAGTDNAGNVQATEAVQGTDAGKAGAGTDGEGRLTFEQIREMYADDLKKYTDSVTKDAVEKRLRREKGATQTLKKLQPLIDRAGRQYGIDPKDTDAVLKAVADDKSYYEQLAIKNGTTPEVEEELDRSRRETRELQEVIAEREEADAIRENAGRIVREINEVKAKFPDFNLEEAMKNETFAMLVKNPQISMLTAYKAVSFDNEINRAVQTTAKTVEANVANKIKSGSRPTENAMSAASPADVTTDYSKLSLEECRSIIQAAKMRRNGY